mgnify:CR=1 FL=1
MIQVNRIYLIFNRLVTKKFLVDTSVITKEVNKVQTNVLLDIKNLILLLQKNKGYVCKHIPCAILKC